MVMIKSKDKWIHFYREERQSLEILVYLRSTQQILSSNKKKKKKISTTFERERKGN